MPRINNIFLYEVFLNKKNDFNYLTSFEFKVEKVAAYYYVCILERKDIRIFLDIEEAGLYVSIRIYLTQPKKCYYAYSASDTTEEYECSPLFSCIADLLDEKEYNEKHKFLMKKGRGFRGVKYYNDIANLFYEIIFAFLTKYETSSSI